MSKPIYIVVTPFFPAPGTWRGAYCFDFATALMRTGKYDVRVFVSRLSETPGYTYHGVRVHTFVNRRFKGAIAPFLLSRGNRSRFIGAVAAAGIDWKDVAVFHAHDIGLVPLAKNIKKLNPKIKILLHFHNMGHPFCLRCGHAGVVPIYSTLHYLWHRHWFEIVDLPVFVSRRQRDMFGCWYPEGYLGRTEEILDGVWFGRWIRPIKLRPSYVLYNGIDSRIFNKLPMATGADYRRGAKFVIGDVANVAETKDPITLLRALAWLKDENYDMSGWRCIFVGSGDQMSRCMAFIKNKGISDLVEIIPEVDHLKLPDIYKSLDLFVLPSWAEGFGCAYVEATGCGVSIMGCMGVSVDEVFSPEEQDKWLFPPQDYKALAEKIKWFYENRPKQTLVRNFDIDVLVGEFVDHLERMRQNDVCRG